MLILNKAMIIQRIICLQKNKIEKKKEPKRRFPGLFKLWGVICLHMIQPQLSGPRRNDQLANGKSRGILSAINFGNSFINTPSI